jgi:hypothetical protein
MISKIAEFMRLDFVLLSIGIVDAAFSGAVSPRFFDNLFFTEEIRCLDRVRSSAQRKIIQFRMFNVSTFDLSRPSGESVKWCFAQRQRWLLLLRGHVHAIVIARAVLAGRHKPLCFVRPQTNQIAFRALFAILIKAAQCVIIEQQFQNVFT